MSQQYHVISSSVNTSYTGSIAFCVAVAGNDVQFGSSTATASLDRIEYGNPNANPHNRKIHGSTYIPTSTVGNFAVPVGTVIQGPIGALKTGGEIDGKAGWLIYSFSNI